MVRQIRLVFNTDARDAAEDRGWLASQGFSLATLPKRATWYRADGLPIHNLPTDSYHQARYRERGCTLVPPSGVGVPSAERAPQANQPADITSAEPVVPRPRMSRLAREVLRIMDGRDSWEGTATELFVILFPHAPAGGYPYRVVGMPLNPSRLFKEFPAPRVAVALDAHGVTVARGYRGHERVLRLCRR